MDEARVLIIGANGQLGSALRARFPKAQAHNRETLDITDLKSLRSFDWRSVDVILNAAAYTDVDGAETPGGREAAWKVNAQAVGYVSRIAAEYELTLAHFSTDYVFDGTISPHAEDEPLTPVSVYGQSKAAGEIAAACLPRSYTVRTSWLIGAGHNFVRTMIGLAEKNISPSVVNDQVGRPTFTGTLAGAIDHLLRSGAAYGTYNVSNDGPVTSWCDFARTIFKHLGRDDLTVSGITTEEYVATRPAAVAPRPRQSTLDLRKINATGLTLASWRDDLSDYVSRQFKGESTRTGVGER